jgi:hypothetical protein
MIKATSVIIREQFIVVLLLLCHPLPLLTDILHDLLCAPHWKLLLQNLSLLHREINKKPTNLLRIKDVWRERALGLRYDALFFLVAGKILLVPIER